MRVPFEQAEVELKVDARVPVGSDVRGSSNHLLQVLINILLNAKDASVRGSIVELSCRAASLDSGPDVGQELVIQVRDHGQGIPAELLEKVFDPFFTTKDVDKGTGLGLAISHGIVERHDGRIEIESEVDRGTCFRIVLPMVRSIG